MENSIWRHFVQLGKGVLFPCRKARYSTLGAKSSLHKVTDAVKRPKKRLFDAHTLSIWSRNIAIRGENPQAGLQLLLKRLEGGRLPPTTPLYNTALSICSRQGWTEQCGKLLAQMVARNVPSDERTICSILKAIAVRSAEFKNETTEIGVTEIEMLPFSSDFSTALPGIEVFTVNNRTEAIQLAFRLYHSWIDFNGGRPTLFLFNNLLNVLAKCRDTMHLQQLLPYRGPFPKNCPADDLDIITFTTSIIACQNNFLLARKYWQRAEERLGKVVDDQMIGAMTWCLLTDLILFHREAMKLKERRCFTKELLDRAMKLAIVSDRTAGNLLSLAVKLKLYKEGQALWQTKIIPVLLKSNFSQASKLLNEHGIKAILTIYKSLGEVDEILNLQQCIQKIYGTRYDGILNRFGKIEQRYKKN